MIPSHNQWPMAATQLAPTDWNYVHWWWQSFRPTKLVTYHHCLQTSDLSHWPAVLGKYSTKSLQSTWKDTYHQETSLNHQLRKASSVKSMVQWNIYFTWVPYWKTPEPSVPIFATFHDLKNAFGFVPHALIVDMFHHIWLPLEVTSYICGQLVFQGPGCCII